MTTIDLSCARGDTAEWTLTATRDGEPVDLTDALVIFAARRNYASPVLFERTSDPGGGIVIADPPDGGIARIKLRREDTLVLPNDETDLVFTVHVVTAGGDEWMIVRGTLTVGPIAWDGEV